MNLISLHLGKLNRYVQVDPKLNPQRPCYDGLRNNVPTTLLRMSLNSWRDGTEEIVQHQIIKEYIQTTSIKTGVDDNTLYNTRVDSVVKQGHKWQVSTSTLLRDDSLAHITGQSWVRR